MTAVREEIRDSRVALAAAKVAKTVNFQIPKLDRESSEYKKKKRDAIKSARDALKSIGVEDDVPACVTAALNAA